VSPLLISVFLYFDYFYESKAEEGIPLVDKLNMSEVLKMPSDIHIHSVLSNKMKIRFKAKLA